MNKKLWEASKKIKDNSNLFKFEKFISKKYKKTSLNFKMIIFDHPLSRQFFEKPLVLPKQY